jgi:molecular chaperone GrpE
MNKDNEQKKKEQKKEKQEKAAEEKRVTLSEEEYNNLKQEADKSRQYWERILLLQADFENSRKRLEREKQEFLRIANKELIADLLNVVDDLERSLQLAQEKHEDFSAFLKGTEMVLAHLYDLLKKQGLLPIEAKGKGFDPKYHEALLNVETNDVAENTIVEELQKGYLLNNQVIRTAKVKVAKKPDTSNQIPEDNGQLKDKKEEQ